MINRKMTIIENNLISFGIHIGMIFVFLGIGLLNGMFAPIALKLKRWKEC